MADCVALVVRRSVHVLVFTVSTLIGSAAAEVGETYVLGPQDKLRIYIHEWPALTGEFTVGAGGNVALPLVGTLPAAGLETGALAREIASRLQEKAGLTSSPDAMVDIVAYRPFYILGGVETPGEYAYRPGMTVLNAVSIGGGLYRASDSSTWALQKDAITGVGDLRVLDVQREALEAKAARLAAEAEDAEAITFKARSTSEGEEPSPFAEPETVIFEAGRAQLESEVTSLERTIALHNEEIEALQAQIAAEQSQHASVQGELEDIRGLVAKGLAPAPRVLPLERTLAQIEREQRELDTSIIRSRQQINQAESAIDTLKSGRRRAAVAELRDTEAKLQEISRLYATAQRVVAASSLSGAQSFADTAYAPTPRYTVMRAANGEMREEPATETTRVMPGDIVKVQLSVGGESEASDSSETLAPSAARLSRAGGSGPRTSEN